MTRLPLSLCLVLASCTGLLVIAAVPAHAIQYMTPGFPGGGGGTSEKETAVDKLKKKWEEQPEVVKEEVREQVDKAKDIAKEEAKGQAKKAGEKVWKKIKKLKKFGKYAKKAGEVLKRYKRVLGPVGQVLDAAEKGYKTGGKIHQRIVGPLMAAHFDRKDEEWQRQLQEDIAKIRRNAPQRNNQTPASPAPEPDTLEHYADQTLQDYLDSLPPMEDSQDFAEVLEQYNEAAGSEQPASYEAPQEPYQDDYMDDLPPMDDSQEGYMEALERYNEALQSKQPAPYETPQEPYREDPVDNYQAALDALDRQEAGTHQRAEGERLQHREDSPTDQRVSHYINALEAGIAYSGCLLEWCQAPMQDKPDCSHTSEMVERESERFAGLFASDEDAGRWAQANEHDPRVADALQRLEAASKNFRTCMGRAG